MRILSKVAACFLLTLAAASGLSGCGGSSASEATTAAVAPTVTVSTTVEVTATPSPSESESEVPAEVESTTAAPETFTMPKLVGQNLQLAQDMLQKDGSFLLDQVDALGLGRIQVMDSNWQVCTQSPKAGKEVPVDTMVTLASVKLTEDCP
ncbi:hypothetical protein GCM10023153_28500 [Ornithinibacter aureus]|uniref:PASTA domain-containing protein n=1 Tax=Ornithinibacter aureus TaxID=622664 RepID=A0ABP8K525_9MICO|nr:PASTA domain-containing protein [Ornithinibacter aureus]